MALSVYALIVLAFGATIGLMMAAYHFRGIKSGKGVGLLHGAFTVSGLTMLVIAAARLGRGWGLVAGFLVVAAGGAYLYYRQSKDEPWPALVIVAHGGLAIVMLVTLGLWLGGVVGEPGDPVLPDSPEIEETFEGAEINR